MKSGADSAAIHPEISFGFFKCMPECKKRPYPNRKEALAAMNSYNKEFEIKAKYVYKCPYCGFHHFTTMKRSQGKNERKWHIKNKNQ